MRIHFQLKGVGYEKNCFYQTSEHKPKLIDHWFSAQHCYSTLIMQTASDTHPKTWRP